MTMITASEEDIQEWIDSATRKCEMERKQAEARAARLEIANFTSSEVIEGLGVRIKDLEEAIRYALNQMDYLRKLWGDEGITRNVADRLREAVDDDD